MKVYVENLPKKCGDCPCCSGNQYCNYMWEHYTDTEKPHFDECNLKDYCKVPYDFNNNMKKYKEWLDNLPKNNDEQHKNCPLQSLADYTKQVRKDVCEKIKNLGEPFPYKQGSEPYMWIISQKDLDNILEEYKEK